MFVYCHMFIIVSITIMSTLSQPIFMCNIMSIMIHVNIFLV